MRRVLMIAFHYPPVRVSSGFQRTLKFSAYLGDHGWEPIVLTVSPRAYESVGDDQMADVPRTIDVHRTFALDTARHLAIRGRYSSWLAEPDRWVSWLPSGILRGLAIIRGRKPDVIFSTYPIATAHLIGLALHKASGLPWVADFRDSMTEPGYPRRERTWKIHRAIERSVMRSCTSAVFTTDGSRAMYQARYPERDADALSVIENGFDEDNFTDAERHHPPVRTNDALTLVHSGVLYPEERDPRPFFQALRKLLDAGTVAPGSLRVVLRATGSDAIYRDLIDRVRLGEVVELAPSLPYRQALAEMLHADGLLLFQAPMCNHQVPAKLYEYLRAGRPIFALTDPEGNSAQRLMSTGNVDIAHIGDPAGIATALSTFIERVRRGEAKGTPPEVAAEHSRRARTAELARLLDGIVAVRRRPNDGRPVPTMP